MLFVNNIYEQTLLHNLSNCGLDKKNIYFTEIKSQRSIEAFICEGDWALFSWSNMFPYVFLTVKLPLCSL